MAMRRSQKWVISDGEDEDDEVGLDVRELFTLSKKKAVSEPQVNGSEETEGDKFYTPNGEFAVSRASSQLTVKESDTEKYFTADEENTSNTRAEDSMDTESVSDEEKDSDANIRPKVGQGTCAVTHDNDDENSEVIAINEKEDVVNAKSKNSSTQKSLISDIEEEKTVSSEEEDSEANIRPKVGRTRCTVIHDDDDESSDVITINEKEDVVNSKSKNSSAQKSSISDKEEEKTVSNEEEDSEANIRPKVCRTRCAQKGLISDEEEEEEIVSNEEEDSESNIRPKVGRARCAVIYDDEDEDSEMIVINEKEDIVVNDGSKKSRAQQNLISDEEEEETDKAVSNKSDEPVPKKSKIVKPFSTVQGFQKSAEKNWWEQFLEPVPDNQKCNIEDCSFAPQPHKKHDVNTRSYSTYETRLIIKYLIHYDLIQYGKGLQVWKDLHALGYLKHRSVESLNNHFKRYLLRDIKSYKLPKDIEDQFLILRTSRKGY